MEVEVIEDRDVVERGRWCLLIGVDFHILSRDIIWSTCNHIRSSAIYLYIGRFKFV